MLLLPAETQRSQWDLGVRGKAGLVFVSFSAPSNQLAALVEEKVTRLSSTLT